LHEQWLLVVVGCALAHKKSIKQRLINVSSEMWHAQFAVYIGKHMFQGTEVFVIALSGTNKSLNIEKG